MALNSPADPRRHRGVSISFEAIELEWVDALVEALAQERYPLAARSEVVRVGLLELREALRGKTRAEIVRYFAQRHADRLVASVGGQPATTSAKPESDADT